MSFTLSIIIPCFNVGQWIEETLFSIFIQFRDDIEVIVINDGSSDDTAQRIVDFCKGNLNFNIKYFKIRNEGLSGARDYGKSKASGKYIWFLDGDDVLKNGAINEILNLINEYPNSKIIAFQGYDFEDRKLDKNLDNYAENNSWLIQSYQRQINGNISFNSRKYLIEKILEKNFLSNACFYIIQVELIDRINLKFIPRILFEDVIYTLELFLSGEIVTISDKRLIFHRRRKGSIMRSKISENHIKSGFVIVEEIFRLKKIHSESIALNQVFLDYLYLALRRVRENNYLIYKYIIKYCKVFFHGARNSILIRSEIKKNIICSTKRILIKI